LERLNSPERLDELMQVVGAKSWIALGALGALVVIGVAWGFWGTVPVSVEGRGVLIHPRQVVDLQSPVGGILEAVTLRVGQMVKKGEELGTLDRHLERYTLAQKQEELSRRTQRQTHSAQLHAKKVLARKDLLARQRLVVEKRIKDTRAQADSIEKANKKAIASRRKGLREQLALFRSMSERLGERVERYTQLEKKGVINKLEILQLEETAMNTLLTCQSLQSQLEDLFVTEIQTSEQDMTRRHRLLDLESELRSIDSEESRLAHEVAEFESGSEEPLEALRAEVARLKAKLDEESRILSPYAGRVVEVTAVRGQVVTVGTRLAVLETEDPDQPLVAVVCFSVPDGKRVRVGLKAHASPTTVPRERYGSLLGVVDKVGAFPVTSQEVTRVVGNPELATALVPREGCILVFCTLERDSSTVSGYGWSSSTGPPSGLTPGTTMVTRVVVEERSPMSFVFPALRGALE
jgi:HlyD family secretion protein